jgi:hypothetical protein
MDVSAPPPGPSPIPASTAHALHKYSCASCHKRKVKCDRLEPCGYCARHDDQCIYQEPLPPRKRKRVGESNAALRRKLEQYQALAEQEGAIINEDGEALTPIPIAHSPQPARPVQAALPRSTGFGLLAAGRIQPGIMTANSSSSNQASGTTLAEVLRHASREGSWPPKNPEPAVGGRLVADKGKTRFLEKYVLDCCPFL